MATTQPKASFALLSEAEAVVQHAEFQRFFGILDAVHEVFWRSRHSVHRLHAVMKAHGLVGHVFVPPGEEAGTDLGDPRGLGAELLVVQHDPNLTRPLQFDLKVSDCLESLGHGST